MRRGRASLVAPPLARGPAPRGGAGRRGHVRSLPQRVAQHRPGPPRHRRARRGDRTTARGRDTGIGPRARCAARSGRGLPPRDARRAVRGGRAGVDRCGRARSRRRPRAALLPRPGQAARVVGRASRSTEGPLHDAIREQFARAGASFWPDIAAATLGSLGTADEAVLLTALWDLVWAGEITNDTFGPLRVPRRASKRTSRARPHPGRLTRLGPPAGAGRWSLVAPLLDPAPSSTEIAHAIALQLLDRHGVVTREAVRAEGTPGGFAGVYPVFRALEESGRARRGWFVAGLGAAQFALPGAVDRLRAHKNPPDDEPGRVSVLAATDPAQPYGAALSWPEPVGGGRPSRTVGAHVVLVDGECVAYVERGGRGLLTFSVARRDRRARLVGERAGRGAQRRSLGAAPDRTDRRRARTHVGARPAPPRRGIRRRLQRAHAPQVTARSSSYCRSPLVPHSGGSDGISRQGQGHGQQGRRSGQARDRGRQGEVRRHAAPEEDQRPVPGDRRARGRAAPQRSSRRRRGAQST